MSCNTCMKHALSASTTSVARRAAQRTSSLSPLFATTRWHSTSRPAGAALASDAYTSPFTRASVSQQANKPTPVSQNAAEPTALARTSSASATTETPADLSPADRQALESMLRVDHAGEIAANTIYSAQANVFGALGDPKTKQMMLDMWENEKKHLKVAEKLLAQHKTRPSLLLPLWSLAGTVLGASTALMGKEAAMACTEAVETVIGEHYDDQLTHLRKISASSLPQGASNDAVQQATDGGAAHPSIPLLSEVITEFRDDELEHLDTAVEHDAQQAPAHALLSAIIGWGCKGAIQVAKRI